MQDQANQGRNSPSQQDEGQFKKAKQRLASNPDTSPETLDKLSKKDEPTIKERVAENPKTTSSTLKELSENDSAEVKLAVAENTNTPSESLETLAEDPNPDVRYRLAENPNTPREILESLKKDENPYVNVKAEESLQATKSISQQADELLTEEHFKEAEQQYRELLTGLERFLGPDHIEVGEVLHKLAASLVGQGKTEDATQIEKRAQVIKAAHQRK